MKTKQLFLLSALCLLAGNSLFAQDRRHEISLGYGLGTTSDFLDAFSDVLATAVSGGEISQDNENYSGAVHLSYKYLVMGRLGVGGTLVYEHANADAWQDGVHTGRIKRDYYTIAAEVDYRYVRRPFFTLYSGLGLGYTSHNEKYQPGGGAESSESTGHFNFQVTGIGARFGARVGGFAEAGFGYKGLFCVGAYARF
ncbi:outer membrane beta-barrel protein [Chitinophaga japonensis]|uniref:Outer membrane protein with beta-barrel domain n=1 Tax=Chitinophaga japonensis TaxID=104662 RepID=A0A562SSI6_CHIJA|nr:outer membrane beta-barrel protein [Chitinophaga japonensis]TWI84093.1 outer membrane protein with beta-barrel domain [Chitinophaga japonensis]